MANRQSAGRKPTEKSLANLTGGSRAGIPNRNTALLKDMILGALDKAGGVEYLSQQAEKNPGPFMALVGKVLPMQVTGDPNAPLTFSIVRREVVRPDADNTNC